MSSYQVVVNFNDSVNNYDLPHVFAISDPESGMKATVIEGTRGSGSVVIPGGRKSQKITIRGNLFDADGYEDLSVLIQEMKTKVTTDVATLVLKYWTGTVWQNTWQFTVRRIDEINFSDSLRLDAQEYSIDFLVIAY